MTKILSALSFAALIGALISAVVSIGLGAEIGFDLVWETAPAHLMIGLGLIFVLSYPVVLLVDARTRPYHQRVFERAKAKRETKLSIKEQKCYYPLLFRDLVESHGLCDAIDQMGQGRARRTVECFRHIGLPRLANMLEEYLDALDRGDFKGMNAAEKKIYASTCRAIQARMNSAGLAKLPAILDDALK